MRRYCIFLAAAVSLLLSIAATSLWVRSYWADEGVFFGNGGGQRICTHSGHGKIRVVYFDLGAIKLDRFAYATWKKNEWLFDVWLDSDPRGWLAKLGIDATGPGLFAKWTFGVPHAFIVLATGVMPAWVLARRWRRRRGPPATLCAACGYDVRATPNRCPECGTSPKVTIGAHA